jgi:hypothetical protein
VAGAEAGVVVERRDRYGNMATDSAGDSCVGKATAPGLGTVDLLQVEGAAGMLAAPLTVAGKYTLQVGVSSVSSVFAAPPLGSLLSLLSHATGGRLKCLKCLCRPGFGVFVVFVVSRYRWASQVSQVSLPPRLWGLCCLCCLTLQVGV